MKYFRQLIVSACISISFAYAAHPEKTGLHLSFHERVAATYAILAQGESEEIKTDILNRAKNYFIATFNLPPQVVKVSNFGEFLELYKGPWPNMESVSLDIEALERKGPQPVQIFEAKSPRVQNQIERYLSWRKSQLFQMLTSKKGILDFLQKENIKDPSTAHVLPPSMDDRDLQRWLYEKGDALIGKKIRELDEIGEKIADSSLGAGLDTTTKITLQTILSEYFSRLSPASKKLIISSYLGGDLLSSDLKKFEIMVQNSGPQFQKLLQVMARQANLSPEILEIFRTLESSVRAVPWEQVQQILKAEEGRVKFTYFERKPLGIGTMAQVHRAKFVSQGKRQDVVVRFIKPGIEKRVREDQRILSEIAEILDANEEFQKMGMPKMKPVVQDITQTVMAELKQDETLARQKLAATRYNQSVPLTIPGYKNEIEFHVPEIFEEGPDSKILVQKLVIGNKLDKEIKPYENLAPEIKRAIIEQMARIWVYEAIFGGGFYHSDLHQGNFLVQITDPKIIVNILDYGMGGVISKKLQGQAMLLGAGVELLDPDIIYRSYWDISVKGQNTVSAQQFKFMVADKVSNILSGREPRLTLEKWTAWAMKSGVQLPYEFFSLNRGLVIINKLLEDSGSKLSVQSLMRSLARRHPFYIYKKLVVENKMSHRSLIKLGWMDLKSKLESPVKMPPNQAEPIRCEEIFLRSFGV